MTLALFICFIYIFTLDAFAPLSPPFFFFFAFLMDLLKTPLLYDERAIRTTAKFARK